jgi:hypothetical protein
LIPSTSVGKIRLRIGDWQDLPILPDSVIESAITDCQNNVPRAAQLCAQYILATLTAKTHRKMSNLETWSGEQFDNYVKFIKMTILNPHLMTTSPVPYAGDSEESPMNSFIRYWNHSFAFERTGGDYSGDLFSIADNGIYGPMAYNETTGELYGI